MVKKIKLLDAIERVKEDHSLVESIYDCLEDRISWLEDREPDSDGIVYETWEEKHDAMEECMDLFEEAKNLIENEADENEITEAIEEASDSVIDFQYEFGGLSRLVI